MGFVVMVLNAPLALPVVEMFNLFKPPEYQVVFLFGNKISDETFNQNYELSKEAVKIVEILSCRDIFSYE